MKDQSSTSKTLQQYKNAILEAASHLQNENYQQAMAHYFEASQSADEMFGKFISLLMKTAPNSAYRILLVEVLSWRLRYYTTQYDYHLSVAQTLSGLPREEWLARLETILVLSQTLVDKLILLLKEVEDFGVQKRIRSLLSDWVAGIQNLVYKLKIWGISSSQAARVLEWALDNGLTPKKE